MNKLNEKYEDTARRRLLDRLEKIESYSEAFDIADNELNELHQLEGAAEEAIRNPESFSKMTIMRLRHEIARAFAHMEAEESNPNLNTAIETADAFWEDILNEESDVNFVKRLFEVRNDISELVPEGVLQSEADELMSVVSPADFDKVGKFIRKAIVNEGGEINLELLEADIKRLKVPVEMVERIIDCYLKKGVILKKGTSKYKLGKICSNRAPSFSMLQNVGLATKYMYGAGSEEKDESTTRDISSYEEAYNSYWEKNTIEKIDLKFKEKDGVKVMHITEALFGYKDFDYKFAYRVVDTLKELPEDERPDILSISGLIFGNFQHTEKDNRRARVMKENDQFAHAKKFMDACLELGVPVVYNMSDNDFKIAHSRTYDALKIMKSLEEPESDSKKQTASYHGFDRMKQDKAWEYHFRFQYDVVFEYMLRCGRRLRSADEMAAKYGPEARIEEYLLLLETYNALKEGGSPSALAKEVIEIEKIPVPGKKRDDFIFAHDFDLSVETKNGEYTQHVVHEDRQTEQTLPRDPNKGSRDLINQLEAMGIQGANTYTIQNQEICMALLTGDNTMVVTTPSMNRYRQNQNAYARFNKADKSSKSEKARHLARTPGAIMEGKMDNGIRTMTFFNDHLMNLAVKSPFRYAIVHNSDWQSGSPTMRADYQAIWFEWVMHEVATQLPTFIMNNGDIRHGRNYPMENECSNMGLVRIDDQMEFHEIMLENILNNAPKEAISNVIGVGSVPGNHETNGRGGYESTGATHTPLLRNIFRRFNIPSKSYHVLATGRGAHLRSHTGIENLDGVHKFMFMHKLMERGGKGSGAIPVLQARDLITGMGSLSKEVDLFFGAHYHSPSAFMGLNKIASINGAMADLSDFELVRGFRPSIGGSVTYVGGGLPPRIDFFTEESCHKYEPKGYYSKENLKKKGFEDDKDFDPQQHGFGKLRIRKEGKYVDQPLSAVSKSLWDTITDIQWRSDAEPLRSYFDQKLSEKK